MQCKLPLGAGDGPVAFFGSRFSSWESYQSGSGYNGGEAYWGADRQLPGYHRIIIDAVDTHMLLTERRGGVIKPLVQIPALKDSSILCRTRFFYYWPVLLNPLLAPRLGFDERSILMPNFRILSSRCRPSRRRPLALVRAFFLASSATTWQAMECRICSRLSTWQASKFTSHTAARRPSCSARGRSE